MTEPTYELVCLHTNKTRSIFTEETAPKWVRKITLPEEVDDFILTKFSKITRKE